MNHVTRGTFLAWHLFHVTLKRKINVQLNVAKISTSFVYFSEEICSFQAISDEDVYPKSCTSELPVLLHLCEKLLHWQSKLKSWLLFWISEGIAFAMSRTLGDREVSSQNFRRKYKASRALVMASQFSGCFFFSSLHQLETVAEQLVPVYSGHSSSVISFLSVTYIYSVPCGLGATSAFRSVMRWLAEQIRGEQWMLYTLNLARPLTVYLVYLQPNWWAVDCINRQKGGWKIISTIEL